jgi:electron transfer flavoprotein beta subunit
MPAADLLCVCMKPVWRTDVPLRLDAGGHGPLPGEAQQVANAADLAALRLALHLRDEAAAGAGARAEAAAAPRPGRLRVLALTVGPPAAEDVLREALAAGADEVLRVWGPAWPAQPPAVDATAALTRAHAAAAAAAMRPRRPLLVLAGERSADTGHECFGALLAAELGAAFAHRVTALRRAAGDAGAGWEASVRLERGYGQPLRLAPPAVVTVSAQLPRPPQAPLPAWLASRAAPVPLAAADGAAPHPAHSALRIPRPRVKPAPVPGRALSAEQRIQALVSLEAGGGGTVLVEGTPREQAEAVLKLLRERGYLQHGTG